MAELSREEKKEQARILKEKMKKIEQYAKYRQAQAELKENGIDELSLDAKHEILRAMEHQMSEDQVKSYRDLKLRVVQMNYLGSILGLATAAVLPRNFRKYQQLKLYFRVPVCVGLFLLTQKAVAFKSLCQVDEFEVDFIQKHSNEFLSTQYET